MWTIVARAIGVAVVSKGERFRPVRRPHPADTARRGGLATYRANAGPIPGQASDGTCPQPIEAATRRFVIATLWQAYGAQFGVDRVP